MTIIQELLDLTVKSELDEQMRIFCDQITQEEGINPETYEGPVGPNIFLSLPVEVKHAKEENYICIEREMKDEFIFSHWTVLKLSSASPKRVKIWTCKEVKTDRILKEFVERMQVIKGE